MRILFLGPACHSIEEHISTLGHNIIRVEDEISLDWVSLNCFDFGISYRYKNIIKKDIIDYFQGRLINLHISLLPWNRGADPNLWSYLDNTPRGVTIHIIDQGIDTGNIILQNEVFIDTDSDTLSTSYEKLSYAIEQLFINNSSLILNYSIQGTKQTPDGSFHLSTDKNKYLYLIEEKWWDTQVKELIHKIDGGGGQNYIKIYKIQKDDCEFIFKIANDAETRKMSFRTHKITVKEHTAWFERQLQDDSLFYIAYYNTVPCGYARFEGKKDNVVISVAVVPEFRSSGLGTKLVQSACRFVLIENDISCIHAFIKNSNVKSFHTFLKAGFITNNVAYSKDIIHLQYPGYAE
jgi:methionyl-tRNA formyltransferase